MAAAIKRRVVLDASVCNQLLWTSGNATNRFNNCGFACGAMWLEAYTDQQVNPDALHDAALGDQATGPVRVDVIARTAASRLTARYGSPNGQDPRGWYWERFVGQNSETMVRGMQVTLSAGRPVIVLQAFNRHTLSLGHFLAVRGYDIDRAEWYVNNPWPADAAVGTTGLRETLPHSAFVRYTEAMGNWWVRFLRRLPGGAVPIVSVPVRVRRLPVAAGRPARVVFAGGDAVALRRTPVRADASLIRELPNGTRVRVAARHHARDRDGFGWYLVRAGDDHGYVRADLVRSDPDAAGAPNAWRRVSETVAKPAEVWFSPGDSVALRTAADPEARRIEALDNGQDVRLLARREDGSGRAWVLVRPERTGNIGYVRGDLLGARR